MTRAAPVIRARTVLRAEVEPVALSGRVVVRFCYVGSAAGWLAEAHLVGRQGVVATGEGGTPLGALEDCRRRLRDLHDALGEVCE